MLLTVSISFSLATSATWAVSTDEAEELAISLNIRLLEASAKSAYNVVEASHAMAGMIRQRIMSTQDGQPVHAALAHAVESAAPVLAVYAPPARVVESTAPAPAVHATPAHIAVNNW